jgi:hypothetical protein
MAMHQITLTIEELESIKEDAAIRAEELEWQLRREIAHLRAIIATAAPRRSPPPPPASRKKIEALRAALLENPHFGPIARA